MRVAARPHRNIFFILLALILATSYSANAESPVVPAPSSSEEAGSLQPTAWVAHVLRRPPAGGGIKGLVLPNSELSVLLHSKNSRLRPLVEWSLSYRRAGWVLYLKDGSPVASTGPGEFLVQAYLNARVNEIDLIAKGSAGELESERFFIFSPQAQEFKVVSYRDNFFVSLGLADMTYAQGGFGLFSSVSGLLSLAYSSNDSGPGRWGIVSSIETTILTLTSSPVAAGPQLVEGKLDASYLLTSSPLSRRQTHALLGASYLTMFSNGSQFGFSNLIAPEIGLRSLLNVNSTTAWIGELRFVFLGDPLTFGQRGFDVSVMRRTTLESQHRLQLGLALSNYAYQPSPEVWVRTNVVSVRTSYSF